jgi:transcriptional regulator with XRE-family HTH domain
MSEHEKDVVNLETEIASAEHPGKGLSVVEGQVSGGSGELSGAKKLALENLMWGMTMADTARRVGVSRMTLHRWLKNDPVFRAAYNEWLEEAEESCRARLGTMARKAMDAMENALHASDGRLALQLLKELGFLRRREAGATDAEGVKRELKIEDGKKKRKLREAEMELEVEE